MPPAPKKTCTATKNTTFLNDPVAEGILKRFNDKHPGGKLKFVGGKFHIFRDSGTPKWHFTTNEKNWTFTFKDETKETECKIEVWVGPGPGPGYPGKVGEKFVLAPKGPGRTGKACEELPASIVSMAEAMIEDCVPKTLTLKATETGPAGMEKKFEISYAKGHHTWGCTCTTPGISCAIPKGQPGGCPIQAIK